ncbi:hypothetical protein SCHPADRAFT_608545 [Schizopora paradoxa]|uniref:RING-type domain-containing protein n=1 Tax=Schizopora paradoxa TaxID=27342 RepID=A0A0H2R9E3_9AGAM|nr:hypothetical protein SCHPADRAFT_608545 [Schizopora paradoxa]
MVSTRGSAARTNQNGEIQSSASTGVELGKRRRPRKSGASSSKVMVAESDSQETDDIESYIANVTNGVANLRREIKRLRSDNQHLQSRIDALHEADDVSLQPKRGKRGGESIESLKSKVKNLTDEVSRLQFAREKDKKKIRKLQKREIEADAADLQGEGINATPDSTDKMRKLLRRFYDLVTSPSLEEDEECCICCEILDPKAGKARSLQCQHTICSECLAQLRDPTCPTCREPIGEEVEAIEFTATQQWDALLAVAADWARIDSHGGDEAEETEEEEEPFINDDNASTNSGVEQNSGGMEDEPANGDDSALNEGEENEETERLKRSPRTNNRVLLTPPPGDEAEDAELNDDGPTTPSTSKAAYATSPAREKRKRMEELAEMRRSKKRF